jgi:DNA-directed RNA polymerase I, II, and III subunit RPABC2
MSDDGDGYDHEGMDDMGSDNSDGEVDIITDDSDANEEENKDGGHVGRKKREKIPDNERITSRFMTKYEKARILGSRALQISKNAPLMVDPGDESDPYRLAELELSMKKVPFIVRRYMPDGSYEDWKASDLYVD